ncbi:MAG: FAD:protein FMN transferase [Myxococcota bacterium]|nr:FAD:protein FMN transferase [Myxococcota bacterium]
MTSGSSRPSQRLSPRARLLLPLFLAVLLGLTLRQLWCAVPDRVVLSGPAMGTTWTVTLAATGRSRADLDTARSAVEERLETVNRLMSTWQPDSELSRLNAHASTEPFAVSGQTLEVLRLARDVSQKTGGAFDVTVRPLVALWGFGADARAPDDPPAASEVAEVRSRVGYRLLDVDPTAGSVRKARPDLACDLSAIAKGYGVDQAAEALEALGWSDFFVEVGGEVRVRGQRPGGGAWRVGIERPDEAGRVVFGVLELRDRSMATSGDYREFYEQGGERRSHIIDPRTGRPVGHGVASVSVVHERAVLADAWATALSVLGPDEGARAVEAGGFGAFFVLRTPSGGYETRAIGDFPEVRLRPSEAAGEGSEPAG